MPEVTRVPGKSPDPYSQNGIPTRPLLHGNEPDQMLSPQVTEGAGPRGRAGARGAQGRYEGTKSFQNHPTGPDRTARLGEGKGGRTSCPACPPGPSPFTSLVSTELLPRNLSFQSLDSSFSMAGTTRRHQGVRSSTPNTSRPRPASSQGRPLTFF